MKKKLIIVVVVALLGVGGAYKFVLAGPKKAEAKPKVEGDIYVLPKEFLVNLADGRFAKLQVALVVEPAAGGRPRRRPRRVRLRRRATARSRRRRSSAT